jgi:hypothetical protein
MTQFTRRSLLAATGATAAAYALPAYAATPYTFRHGAFDVTVMSDGHLVLPTHFWRRRQRPSNASPC